MAEDSKVYRDVISDSLILGQTSVTTETFDDVADLATTVNNNSMAILTLQSQVPDPQTAINTADILTIQGQIPDPQTALNTSSIAINTGNIATNTSDIATNTSDIATNTSDIATNTSDIATNTGNIATNTSDITTNTSDIATNTSDIATNAGNIATNTSDIATNTGNIATNTSDIATNTGNIAMNTADIATNTADITTNTADIITNTAAIEDISIKTWVVEFVKQADEALVVPPGPLATQDTDIGINIPSGNWLIVFNFTGEQNGPDRYRFFDGLFYDETNGADLFESKSTMYEGKPNGALSIQTAAYFVTYAATLPMTNITVKYVRSGGNTYNILKGTKFSAICFENDTIFSNPQFVPFYVTTATYGYTGYSMNLPAAGKYLILGDVKTILDSVTAMYLSCRYHIAGGASIPNSETILVDGCCAPNNSTQVTQQANIIHTTTGPETIELWAKHTGTPSGATREIARKTQMHYIDITNRDTIYEVSTANSVVVNTDTFTNVFEFELTSPGVWFVIADLNLQIIGPDTDYLEGRLFSNKTGVVANTRRKLFSGSNILATKKYGVEFNQVIIAPDTATISVEIARFGTGTGGQRIHDPNDGVSRFMAVKLGEVTRIDRIDLQTQMLLQN